MSLAVRGTACRGDFSVDIEFTAQPGECVSIVGPNGSGKSTILHTIAGLLSLCAGSIAMDDDVWDSPSDNVWVDAAARSCSVVFQDVRLFPFLSAQRNVEFGLRAQGMSRSDASLRARDALALVGVQQHAQRRATELSGGEQQRVALARALVLQPRVLLLDEPFAAIDAPSRTAFRELLSQVVAQSQIISVMVSHDPIDAESLATQVVRLTR